jgi:hypothetical protein
MSRQTAPRILTTVGIVTMIVAGIGLIASLLLNAYVFDRYDDFDAYGEVPMTAGATSSPPLPAGDVTVYLHTVHGGGAKGALVIPGLHFRIPVPEAGADAMSEDRGDPTTVGKDDHVRIGHLDVPQDGTRYDIKVDGDPSALDQPRLAFGRETAYRILPLTFGVAFGLAVLVLIVARVWAARARRTPVVVQLPPPAAGFAPAPTMSAGDYPPEPPTLPKVPTQQAVSAQPAVSPQQTAPTLPNVPTQQAAPGRQAVTPEQAAPTLPYVPTLQSAPSASSGSGARQKALDTLAHLRDSGALTEDEYRAEKQRVLNGS